MSPAATIMLESNFRGHAQAAREKGEHQAADIWTTAANSLAKAADSPREPLGDRLRAMQWNLPTFQERQRIRARALGIEYTPAPSHV